jgi:glc operon protein GlcG
MRPAFVLELTDAERLLAAALAEARRDRSRVAAAVVDGGGRLIAFRRLDGASPAAAEAAIAKARMAAINGERPALLQLAPAFGQPAAAMGGGIALRWEGEPLGGLGVSGMTPQRDAQIAAAGMMAWAVWRFTHGGGSIIMGFIAYQIFSSARANLTNIRAATAQR